MSKPSRKRRRPAPPPLLPSTIRMRKAVPGDAGSLYVPPGTVVIIEELFPGCRFKRFVVPGEWR